MISRAQNRCCLRPSQIANAKIAQQVVRAIDAPLLVSSQDQFTVRHVCPVGCVDREDLTQIVAVVQANVGNDTALRFRIVKRQHFVQGLRRDVQRVLAQHDAAFGPDSASVTTVLPQRVHHRRDRLRIGGLSGAVVDAGDGGHG